jgi:hypothetical protein
VPITCWAGCLWHVRATSATSHIVTRLGIVNSRFGYNNTTLLYPYPLLNQPPLYAISIPTPTWRLLCVTGGPIIYNLEIKQKFVTSTCSICECKIAIQNSRMAWCHLWMGGIRDWSWTDLLLSRLLICKYQKPFWCGGRPISLLDLRSLIVVPWREPLNQWAGTVYKRSSW